MTFAQRKDLERVLDEPIEILPWKDTVKNISELIPLLRRADVTAVVLPPELIAELLPLMGEKPVLRAVSARRPSGYTLTLPDGRQEQQFDFVHLRWERIVECRIVTEAL